MLPFSVLCDEDLAFREMKVVQIPSGCEVPEGDYGFEEFYCDEPGCDCRQVMIRVVTFLDGYKHWATIGYGWEKLDFYVAKMHGNRKLGQEMKGPSLDPINTQTEYAPVFLRLFKQMIEDEAYVERLKHHYAMAKASQG